jgi:hypothetical protein
LVLVYKEEKTNGLLDLLREVIIDWWTSKTRVSPNKIDVTFKRLEAMVYDEKPTHSLMETQRLEATIYDEKPTHFLMET